MAAASAMMPADDDEGRNDSADYEKQRQLQRKYLKEKRRQEKEAERKKNPEDVTAPPLSRWLPTGTWSRLSRQQGAGGASTKGWKKAAGGGAPPPSSSGGARPSGGEGQPDEDKLVRMIDKSHRIWRQNCPILYEQMLIQPLDQSSLTVQWMPEVAPVLYEVVNPDRTAVPPGLLTQHKVTLRPTRFARDQLRAVSATNAHSDAPTQILFGTFSRDDGESGRRRKDYVMIGSVLFPNDLGAELDRDVIVRRDTRAAANNARVEVRF